ncbi:MAG TPA: acyl-ACP--UDP-N-acetylglucosamine O-acyltransferase [bacterium]|nr:acyl-ACP--UDP-N-acetylglucosamine O-acyltransferase [bacterium]
MSAPRRAAAAASVPEIHPTAVVAPGAHLEAGVVVGPYAVVGEDVTIGAGTRIGPHVVIEEGVRIGRDNVISTGTIIGCLPQDRKFLGERSHVVIGDRNLIREYASISRATGAGEATTIGSDNFVMSYVRIDHNARLGNRVVLVGGSMVAGHVEVDDDAYVSGMTGLHQFVRVGRLAMIGGYTMLRQDCPPFILVTGVPGRARALNLVGLRRNGVAAADRSALRRAFHIFYQSQLGRTRALAALVDELGDHPLVRELIDFLQTSRGSRRGLVRWSGQTEPESDPEP